MNDFISCRPLASPEAFRMSYVDLWSPGECEQLLDSMPEDRWVPIDQHLAGVPFRSAELQRPDSAGNEALFERMLAAFEAVNAELYRFDLTAFSEADPPHAIRYQSGHGHYGPHMDCTETHPLRKLSLIVLLNDPAAFDGGDLDIAGWGPQQLERGRAVFFPSYFWHQVHPVTAGTRIVLVAWCHGPSFR